MDGSVTRQDRPDADQPGTRLLGGLEALALLPLLQAQSDRLAGLTTGGFISGYRGSPLGAYDRALEAVSDELKHADIVFSPGLNEDLAATAVWGSQQVGLVEPGRVQGVFGVWYGKGPGVDRSGDALKHANQAGTSPLGGVVALAGDDHVAKSSSVAFQSEPALIAAGIPILYPADVSELVTFGLHGFAMSRHSGAWSALKCLVDVVETTATTALPDQVSCIIPPGDSTGDRHIRWPDDAVGAERRLWDHKLPAARAYATLNGLDRVTHGASRPRSLGILASGRAWLEVSEWLRQAGISNQALEDAGISVMKVAMVWPLTDLPATWASGAREILVVEDKAPILEEQLRSALYGLDADRRPEIVGKQDGRGRPMLPRHGQIEAAILGPILAGRLAAIGLRRAPSSQQPPITATTTGRPPWFCAGCPHNTSTSLPEGSRAGGGIGCHSMALWMGRGTALMTHMGGEGANWIGQAPFSSANHVFQNLGDGTYAHSGSLAIRAAVAAGVNITYKILYNDAVAMTGGQFVEGHPSPWRVAEQVLAEGVSRLVVVSEERHRYGTEARWPEGVEVVGREHLDRIQRTLRDIPGVTVLLYDQTCAAEKRRRRRHGEYPVSPTRVIINELVCEGCGDCGVQSNCVAVVPADTPYGRKRRVQQSDCNQDLSCLKGFCPSFVTVDAQSKPRTGNGSAEVDLSGVPEATMARVDGAYRIVIAGIGGTGVVTAGRLLGEAAREAGLRFAVLDQTGLAQKNGSVTSHLYFGSADDQAVSAKAPPGGVDLMIVCDLVTALDKQAAYALSPDRSRAVVDTEVHPLALSVLSPDLALDGQALVRGLSDQVLPDGLLTVRAAETAAVLGEAALANTYLLGAAAQRGWLPVSVEGIERSIRRNGVAVERNLKAFRLGRLDVAQGVTTPPVEAETVESVIADRQAFLTRYQNAAYGRAYADLAHRAAAAASMPDGQPFAMSVARNLFKLMAYKDEYEVARLHTDPAFAQDLRKRFGDGVRITHHLAPPMIGSIDPTTGRPRKRPFGPWIRPVMRGLAACRGLRGTPFDPFGGTGERRMERALIQRYRRDIEAVLPRLSAANLEDAVALAGIAECIRGYGPVKSANVDRIEPEWSALEEKFGLGETGSCDA